MATVRFARVTHGRWTDGGWRTLFLRVVLTGVAVFLAVTIVPGIESATLTAGIGAVLVLTVLNMLLRPLLYLLSFPLIILTFGLFTVVINALLLELTAWLVKGFSVSGFWPAVGGALVISIVTTLLNFWLAEPRRMDGDLSSRRPPRIINPE